MFGETENLFFLFLKLFLGAMFVRSKYEMSANVTPGPIRGGVLEVYWEFCVSPSSDAAGAHICRFQFFISTHSPIMSTHATVPA